jgi:hypothetical protein
LSLSDSLYKQRNQRGGRFSKGSPLFSFAQFPLYQ